MPVEGVDLDPAHGIQSTLDVRYRKADRRNKSEADQWKG